LKKPQWIFVAVAILLVAAIYSFGNIIPPKKNQPVVETQHSENDGHDHGPVQLVSTDSILDAAKKRLNPDLANRLSKLETLTINQVDKPQLLSGYHKLSHFWSDSARVFEPYAWYEGEAARLENSEKTLTFAAHLFLGNLQEEQDVTLRKWKALQAKDLFERSLKLNPDNDSSKVGLGACYLFGNISEFPMEGIRIINGVLEKDSTNMYAYMVLINGALISGQYDKAINRLETVNRIYPGRPDMMIYLADLYAMTGDPKNALTWYEKSLPLINMPNQKKEVVDRIAELKK
jgi:tetratricopeptide (TPR) repeat protein